MRLSPAEKAGAVKIKYARGGLAHLPREAPGFSNMRLSPAEKAGAVKIKYARGGLAHLVEHLLCTQGVRSSILLSSTIF